MTDIIKIAIKEKRVLSVDYGLKRTGLAICDQFHITVTPLCVLETESENFMNELIEKIAYHQAGAVVVGVPYRLDGQKSDLIIKIEEFISILKDQISVPVFDFDESFSTINATKTLINIGRKKKKRSAKGEKDKIAAALILRDFLEENSR